MVGSLPMRQCCRCISLDTQTSANREFHCWRYQRQPRPNPTTGTIPITRQAPTRNQSGPDAGACPPTVIRILPRNARTLFARKTRHPNATRTNPPQAAHITEEKRKTPRRRSSSRLDGPQDSCAVFIIWSAAALCHSERLESLDSHYLVCFARKHIAVIFRRIAVSRHLPRR